MLKYTDTEVTFAEVPDEISLCINISGCTVHCPGCHSKWLWEDVGELLNEVSLKYLIENNTGITCVALMGGIQDIPHICYLAKVIKSYNLKVCWYIGLDYIPEGIDLSLFDFIKIGPYIEKYGPLNNPNTNQKMFAVHHPDNMLENITYKFWINESN